MYALRTRFKKEIVSEFWPATKKGSRKVMILCGGAPSYPGKNEKLMGFLAKKGYWVFLPRYRGSWESGGQFLKKSPHLDVLDIINELPKGFKDFWDNKKYKIKKPEIYIIGSSFGGSAAVLASRNKRVKKIVAFSPVVDWSKKSKSEPLKWMGKFMKDAFGQGYRFSKKDWNKLGGGKFYNPESAAAKIDGRKILIFHAKDDKVVDFRPTKKFSENTGAKLNLLDRGGHLSLSATQSPKFWRVISKFLKN